MCERLKKEEIKLVKMSVLRWGKRQVPIESTGPPKLREHGSWKNTGPPTGVGEDVSIDSLAKHREESVVESMPPTHASGRKRVVS